MKLEENQIGIERMLNAPIRLVWKMWTEPEHIQHWWGPNGFSNTISKMEAKDGGEWKFVMHGPDGTDYENFNIFKEVVFHKKLVIVHQGPPYFDIYVYFEDLGETTGLTLVSNFESDEALKKILEEGIVKEGLKQNIDKLETYLPIAEDFVIERIFNAPIETVWKAISDRDTMKEWYFDLKEFKPEVGFKFSFSAGESEEKQYVHNCEIVEAIPQRKLAYTWSYDGYFGGSTVAFELESIGNKTKLMLTHSGIESFPSKNADLAKKNFIMGWTEIIGNSLKKFLNS